MILKRCVKTIVLILIFSVWSSGRKIRRRHLTKENDILARYPGQDDYISPTTHVKAVSGGIAQLPCNLNSKVKDDPAVLVLWYKKGIIKPIYSYDIRRGSAMHWKNSIHLGNRAKFDPSRGMLIIQKISTSDASSYRCRVDFKTNPTLSYGVNLTVIVPPHRLWVVAPSGLEAGSVIGPYQEGDALRLRCESLGGDPTPKVTWWEGRTLLDDQNEISSPQQVANILVLRRLRREDLHRILTCKSTNTNLTSPLKTSVTIDMIFPPKIVRILSGREPLSAGRRYEVTCQAASSRPSATIKWHIKSNTLSTFSSQTKDEGNITISSLQFTPKVEDNGKDLECIGTVPPLPDLPVIDTWKLDVYFPPRVTIRPGRSLNLNKIEENADVYFECEIHANPPVYKIIWYHQGKELHHNVSQGVIISNQSLVLQHVHKSASGHYSCKASNIEGDGVSSKIELTVKFAPVCEKDQALFHGAAPNEKVDIPCYVDAHPKPLSFTWTFNNSGESVSIPDNHVKNNGFWSTVSYTPRTELDYGTLLCRAVNGVGKQKQPCVFHVFPAGRPDPIHNCTQYNYSDSSINIRCHPGFDGGLPQTFVFELFDSVSQKLIANLTKNISEFSTEGLPSATSFNVIAYSSNAKGRSDNYAFKIYTLKDNAEKRTAAIKPAPSDNELLGSLLTPILAISLGVAIGILFVVLIIVSVLKFRKSQARQREETTQKKSTHDPSVHESQKAPSTQVLLQSASMSSENEELNPDLIPRKDDTSLWKNPISVTAIVSPTKYGTSEKGISVPQKIDKPGTYHENIRPSSEGARGIVKVGSPTDQLHISPLEKRQKTVVENPEESIRSVVETYKEWGGQLISAEYNPDVQYRSGGTPWNYSYQNKLKIGSELETIEPLLNDQRESSV